MKRNLLLTLLLFLYLITNAQVPASPSNLRLLGTRSWIRLDWTDNAATELGYKIYWNTTNSKPAVPNATVAANTTRYYVSSVVPATAYYTWVEAYNAAGSSTALSGTATTIKNWVLDAVEASNLSIPSSTGVPAGMQIFWQDEFNDGLLNRNKWSTNYYSTIDYRDTSSYSKMRNNTLPQPSYRMTGNSILLLISNNAPDAFWTSGRKVSSIQTYDWNSNENYLDNKRGGYFEIRARRNNTSQAANLNAAYWFDSPGPDLKYYEEAGNTFTSKTGPVTGVRPRGQVFEIDVFEQSGNASTATYTPFTIHGNVAADGTFQGNLGTYNASLTNHTNWATHGLLWTPTSIKYYLNGTLVKEWSDKSSIKSPNHFMNVFLGMYGTGDSSNMEVDYIRGYQWPVVNGNELPNGGAEYSSQLFPWEGTATVSTVGKRSGNNCFVLAAGQTLSQYVYLDNSTSYQLKYWMSGSGSLKATVENITPVTGTSQNLYSLTAAVSSAFTQQTLDFSTGAEYSANMKTVKVTFSNTGGSAVTLDDLEFQKGGSGGSPVLCVPAGGSHAQDRYITSFTTTGATHNISYTNSAYPPNGYGIYTADSITVAQGSSCNMNIINTPNTKWARAKIYVDWNNNGNFSDAGETVLSVGNASQDNSATMLNIAASLAVPATAATGKIPMRIRYYDAWNTDPGPCGQADYTTTHDFILNITAASIMMLGTGEADNRLMALGQKSTKDLAGNTMIVYANPAVDRFVVQYNSTASRAAKLSLTRVNGSIVLTRSIRVEKGVNKFVIETGNIQPGLYLVAVDSPGFRQAQKIVIK